jgi:septal ring factor EnvC (AmiA/AmiB activator)
MTGDGSRLRARACVPLLVVALVVGLGPASSATTDDRLRRARAELAELTQRIGEQASAENELEAQVASADRRIASAERALGLVLGKRLQVRDELQAARVGYADALTRLHDAVVDSFMASPGGTADADVLGAFLDASSFGELQDRLGVC